MLYDVSSLFEPLQIKHKTLRNRIAMPPMVVNRGLTTPEACAWYGRRAAGGVGLVIVEASNSVDFGSEFTAENLRPLVEVIHAGGALAAIQLFPGLRGQKTTPMDVSREDIARLLAQYRTAADVCAQAGFDAVEPHGAHGFLLNQFFSTTHNQRTDEYGGSLTGRSKLALDIVAAIRPVAQPAGLLILYRHTPVRSGFGYTLQESVALAAELIKAGVDVLDISPASDAAPADLAAPFMQLGIPVIAVNQMDRAPRALEALNEKRATLVAVGRGLIADADWPLKVRQGRLEDMVVCTYCDECHRDLRDGMPVGCTQWH